MRRHNGGGFRLRISRSSAHRTHRSLHRTERPHERVTLRRWAALLVVGLAAGCGGPQQGEASGGECFRDADCKEGLVCVDGECSNDVDSLVSVVEGPPMATMTAVGGAGGVTATAAANATSSTGSMMGAGGMGAMGGAGGAMGTGGGTMSSAAAMGAGGAGALGAGGASTMAAAATATETTGVSGNAGAPP